MKWTQKLDQCSTGWFLHGRETGAIVPLGAPAPTRDEVKEHEALGGHANYRTWCRACVAGRGRSDAHVGATRDEHALPTVSNDYAYLAEAQGDDAERQCPTFVLESGCDRWLSHRKVSNETGDGSAQGVERTALLRGVACALCWC